MNLRIENEGTCQGPLDILNREPHKCRRSFGKLDCTEHGMCTSATAFDLTSSRVQKKTPHAILTNTVLVGY